MVMRLVKPQVSEGRAFDLQSHFLTSEGNIRVQGQEAQEAETV